MQTHQSILLAVALCAGLFTGCATANKPLTVAIVQATVSTGAAFGIEQDPTIVPYLRAATPVICNAAGQGQLDPSQVVQALQAADVAALKTPLGVSVINSALAIYEAVYSYYGTNVQSSVIQPYLQGVCLGLESALPPAGLMMKAAGKPLPPHVQ